jgi:hypothetical protein
MLYLATILITLLLSVPAMSVELFRYRGAAKDGGTLEYVFDAGESGRDRRRFYDDLLPRTGRRAGVARISDNAHCVLADLLFRHHQGTDETNVFCRPATGWNGCCTEGGETALVKRRSDLSEIVFRWVFRRCRAASG